MQTASETPQVQEQLPPEAKTKGKKNGSGDVISDFAQEVQTMTKAKVLNFAEKLVEEGNFSDFRLGGALAQIYKEKWHEGYANFDAFTTAKYGFGERKARYLIEIFTALVTHSIPWEKVKDLGWTKLKELAPIITAENVDHWVSAAAPVTVAELQALVRAAKGGTEGAGTPGENVTGTSEGGTFKVKLKADQLETVRGALAKVKAEVGTEYDSVALEFMAAGVLAGTVNIAKTDPKAALEGLGWDAVLDLFGEIWPDIQLKAEVPQPMLDAKAAKDAQKQAAQA